jgi:serine/threonine protein kinase
MAAGPELQGVSTNDPTKLDWAIDPTLSSASTDGNPLPIEEPPGATPAAKGPPSRQSDEDLVASLGGEVKVSRALDESFNTLVAGLELTGLLPSHALQPFLSTLPSPPRHPEALVRELLKSRHLSGYQAGLLLGGRADELLIGPYVVVEKVAEAGPKMMYSAVHKTTHQMAAVKTFPPDAGEGSTLSVSTLLEHPNLIVTLERGQTDDGKFFLATEFLAGGDLVQLVRREGRLPLPLAARYILEATRVLAFVHKEQGLVHGHIGPTNLLLDDEEMVRLSDLGWAGLHPVPPMPHDAAGESHSGGGPSPADLLAPEIFAGAKPDVQSEIYSLGCTLAFLVLGVPMKLSKSLEENTDAMPNIKEFVRESPMALQKVFRHMVAKDRKDRYRTYEEVMAAMEALMDPERYPQLEETDGGFKPLAAPSSPLASPNAKMGMLVVALLLVIVVAVIAIFFK